MPARLGVICVRICVDLCVCDGVANCQIKRLSGFENHCFGTKTNCNVTQKNQKKLPITCVEQWWNEVPRNSVKSNRNSLEQ
jgi:hypothetical protein